MKRAPFDGGAEIEIRQVFSAEDFGEALTPELREQEARLRAAGARRKEHSKGRNPTMRFMMLMIPGATRRRRRAPCLPPKRSPR